MLVAPFSNTKRLISNFPTLMLLEKLLPFFQQSVGSVLSLLILWSHNTCKNILYGITNGLMSPRRLNKCYDCTNLVYTDIFHQSCDSLLFAVVSLFSVGCQQRPIVLTLSSAFSCHGRTISCAAVCTSSKMLGWLEHHFLNGNPALASITVT